MDLRRHHINKPKCYRPDLKEQVNTRGQSSASVQGQRPLKHMPWSAVRARSQLLLAW